jgi:hypothetical protein
MSSNNNRLNMSLSSNQMITSTHQNHNHHNQHNAILAAAQPFYSSNNSVNIQDIQPDRPIGYGAFGVVWFVSTFYLKIISLNISIILKTFLSIDCVFEPNLKPKA